MSLCYFYEQYSKDSVILLILNEKENQYVICFALCYKFNFWCAVDMTLHMIHCYENKSSWMQLNKKRYQGFPEKTSDHDSTYTSFHVLPTKKITFEYHDCGKQKKQLRQILIRPVETIIPVSCVIM